MCSRTQGDTGSQEVLTTVLVQQGNESEPLPKMTCTVPPASSTTHGSSTALDAANDPAEVAALPDDAPTQLVAATHGSRAAPEAANRSSAEAAACPPRALSARERPTGGKAGGEASPTQPVQVPAKVPTHTSGAGGNSHRQAPTAEAAAAHATAANADEIAEIAETTENAVNAVFAEIAECAPNEAVRPPPKPFPLFSFSLSSNPSSRPKIQWKSDDYGYGSKFTFNTKYPAHRATRNRLLKEEQDRACAAPPTHPAPGRGNAHHPILPHTSPHME